MLGKILFCINTVPRLMHTLALCHILWFMHRLVTSSIVVICYFVFAPPQVLAIVTLFFSFIIIIIIFLTIMCSSCTFKFMSIVRFCILLFLLFCILGVIFLFTLFYISLCNNGLQSESLGGIFLSLIPPAIFFLLGLTIKRHFFNKKNIKTDQDHEKEVAQTSGYHRQPCTENTYLL